jgi:LPXTG-motif cell wall-anchored protein
MRITLKISPRFSARRIVQGGAAFAAFGALSIAAAMPAAADTTYGWGYATASGGEAEAVTDVTQSGSASGTTGGLVQVDDCFAIDAETTATVGAGGVTATTVINSARVELTQECLDELPEDDAPAPGEGDEDNAEDDVPEASDVPVDEGDGTEEPPAETDVPVDEETEPEQSEPPVDESPESSDAPAATPSDEAADVVTLNEENSTTVSAEGDVIVDISVTGASVTTTQSWDGDISYSMNPGSSTGDAEVYEYHYVDSYEDEGVTWNDGVTDLYVTFSADEFQVTYFLGTTAAAVATVADGAGNPGGGPGDGDDKNPPARDEEPQEEPAPKTAQPLPQTGSPIIGLVAAGAAIAAGGGAAAYLARRKKTAATAEEHGEG